MEKELDIVKKFNALPEVEKQQILHKQMEQRINEIDDVEKLTNAEISHRDDFQAFCLQKNIEPTKRQVGKNRKDFIEWKKQKEKL